MHIERDISVECCLKGSLWPGKNEFYGPVDYGQRTIMNFWRPFAVMAAMSDCEEAPGGLELYGLQVPSGLCALCVHYIYMAPSIQAYDFDLSGRNDLALKRSSRPHPASFLICPLN